MTRGGKDVTPTEHFAYILTWKSLRELSIKSRYQVKKFNIVNNAARSLDNVEAAISFGLIAVPKIQNLK